MKAYSFEESEALKVNMEYGMEGVGIYSTLILLLAKNDGEFPLYALEQDYSFFYRMDKDKALAIAKSVFQVGEHNVRCQRIVDAPLVKDVDQTKIVKECVPHEKVKDMFNGICGGFFPKVTIMNEKRKTKLRARWKEMSAMGEPLDVLRLLFEKMIKSDFMKKGSWASFDWLMTNSTNWVKVYEGNYDNKGQVSNDYNVNSIWK